MNFSLSQHETIRSDITFFSDVNKSLKLLKMLSSLWHIILRLWKCVEMWQFCSCGDWCNCGLVSSITQQPGDLWYILHSNGWTANLGQQEWLQGPQNGMSVFWCLVDYPMSLWALCLLTQVFLVPVSSAHCKCLT